jgi:hypothetical protein
MLTEVVNFVPMVPFMIMACALPVRVAVQHVIAQHFVQVVSQAIT